MTPMQSISENFGENSGQLLRIIMDGSMHIAVISSNQSVESWDLLAHCACKSRNYMRSALVDPGLTCGLRQGVQELQADQSGQGNL